MSYKILLLSIIVLSIFTGCAKQKQQPVTYDSVTIGSQVWMKSNLDVDRFRNGDTIPYVADQLKWDNLKTGAWCYFHSNSAIGKIYGKLYNWYAVNDPRGLAPAGWHIPSDAEWATLTQFLGGDSIAGGKLKETGKKHWVNPNDAASNSSGFTALPGGWCNNYNTTNDIGYYAYWWTSTPNDITSAWNWSVYTNHGGIYRTYSNKVNGFSVRCIKD
jgi:uncharacterized protein (TIGR02145 family)